MRCGAASLGFIIWTVQLVAQEADGSWSDTQRSNIEAVANALVSLIEQAFSGSIPIDVNLQTVQWPSSFDIGGTTYTGVPSAPTALATLMVSGGIPSNSAVQTFLTSSETFSTSAAPSSTTTAASRTTSSETSQPTSMQEEGSEKSNGGDWKVAIALGIILIVAAFTLAGAVFFALWRRKRRSGLYFKAARCSECVTTPTASILFRAGSVSTSRNDQTGASRSWFSGPRSAFTGSGRSARANSVRANFPEMTESAEKLPIPVDQIKGHAGCQDNTNDVCIIQPRGHTRLRKSYSSTLADVSGQSNETAPIQPSTQPRELAGDGLEVINEMDAQSSVRTAPSLRRLSSFPFVLPFGERANDAANAELGVVVSRSSSGNTNISELDAESPRIKQRPTSLKRLSINPMIMAQLAEAESDYYNSVDDVVISRSNSDNSRPSEMDGESPTRTASAWRELQRSTFTVEDLTAEIEGFNALCEILESSSSETSSLAENRKEVAGTFFDPKSSTAWSELPGSSVYHATTDPIASDSSSSGSSSGGDASEEGKEEEEEGPMGYVFSTRDVLPSSEIRTTEFILPPRPPQPTYSREASSSVSPLSSPPTANYPPALPIADRDLILSRARFRSPNMIQPEVSPLPTVTTNSKPAWAPAGAYATAPIWRKKRPAPLSPDFLRSCAAPTGGVNFGNVFYDSPTLPARSRAAAGGAEAYSNIPWRTKPRPQPLTPDWLPESLRAGRNAIKIAEDDDDDMDLELGEQGGLSGKGDRYLGHAPNSGVGNLASAIGFEMF